MLWGRAYAVLLRSVPNLSSQSVLSYVYMCMYMYVCVCVCVCVCIGTAQSVPSPLSSEPVFTVRASV